MLKGVDVSSFQGPPANWRDAAGSIAWAAVKITELQPGAPYVNPDAAADWDYLAAQGKVRIGYLFGHPAAPADDTAAFFAAEIRKLGLSHDDGIVLDHEVSDGRRPADVAAWGVRVARELTWRLERKPLVYTYLDFALQGNAAGLGEYPLWMADPSSPMGKPRVPPPWHGWAIHQYGTAGMDRDVAAWATPDAMRAAIGRHQAPAKLPPGRHLADGHTSLAVLAHRQGCDVADIIWETAATDAAQPAPAGAPGPLQRRYLNAGDWSADLEKGTVLWLP